MLPIRLEYAFAQSPGTHLTNPLFEVLEAVRSAGSIAGAAKRLDWSYRHLWGFLKSSERSLERPLILWDKGRAARLSPFGEKLLWAETRIRARLAPTIENVAAEIERELSVAFDDSLLMATCEASHDHALVEFRAACMAGRRVIFDLKFSSSLDALMALRAGRCAFAGLHLPIDTPEIASRGSAIQRTFGPLLRLGREKLIRVSRRRQGLLVARGNPRAIAGIEDLAHCRIVNRPAGTGTRVLFDALLARAGLDAAALAGYAHEEMTHMAVATAVASGMADAGFGIQAAAAQFGLDFVPVISEQYFLACAAHTVDSPLGAAVISALQSTDWQRRAVALSGYDCDGAGQVVSLRRTLPWYR